MERNRKRTHGKKVYFSVDSKKKRLLYFAVEYYTAVEKEGMLTLCDSVVGPGEFYAK